MPLDVPIVLAFLYVFMTMNFYGWGIWHDQRFISFTLIVALLYASTALLKNSYSSRLSVSIRSILLCIFIAVAVVGASIGFVQLRAKTAPEGFMSDSGVMVEVAGRFLLTGKNPYSQSYADTELARVPYKDDIGNTKNPALDHNAYPPFLIIIAAVSQRIMGALFHIHDIRIAYVAFYLLLLGVGWKLFGLSDHLVMFLVLIGINPMFISLMVQGANDVVVLAFFIWSLWFLERKHYAVAGTIFGLSLATKQIAWIAVPFVLYYAWKQAKGRDFFRFVSWCTGVCFVVYGPFILWDSKALADGLIFYMSGSLPTSYPISNFGFGMLLVTLHIIPTIYSYYPFWLWQLACLVPVGVLWYRKERRPTIQGVLVGVTVALTVVWFFNRFMNYNYLASLQMLAALAYLWPGVKAKTV